MSFGDDAQRSRYVSAHLFLRRILASYLRLDPRSVPLIRERCPGCGAEHGRPAVAGTPPPLHFSLSRRRDRTLLAVSGSHVGTDIEGIPDGAVTTGVCGMLHPLERAEILAASPDTRGAVFTRLWTRKESLLKGLGIGLGRGLSADYVGTRTAGAADRPPGWSLYDVEIDEGFHAAIALPSVMTGLRIWKVTQGVDGIADGS